MAPDIALHHGVRHIVPIQRHTGLTIKCAIEQPNVLLKKFQSTDFRKLIEN
jgi:hypothetical protein